VVGLRAERFLPLPTRALEAELAQQALELGYACSYALEVLIGKQEEAHRRARRDRGRPLSRQEGRDLAERVAGADVRRIATVGQDGGLALFDELDGGSVAVERGDGGTRLDLELPQRRRELVELRRRKIDEERK
jgi:hypothetical protein